VNVAWSPRRQDVKANLAAADTALASVLADVLAGRCLGWPMSWLADVLKSIKAHHIRLCQLLRMTRRACVQWPGSRQAASAPMD